MVLRKLSILLHVITLGLFPFFIFYFCPCPSTSLLVKILSSVWCNSINHVKFNELVFEVASFLKLGLVSKTRHLYEKSDINF